MSVNSTSRSERRRDATKRQIMGALNNDDASSTASSLHHKPAEFLCKTLEGCNASQVKLLLQDLREKVLHQQQILSAEAQTGKKEQLGAHFAGMMQISSRIKKMTVAEFNQQHQCNLLQLLQVHTLQNNGKGKKRIRTENINKNDLETPAPTKLSSKAQATPSRTVVRGEAIFSKNGSPVDTTEEGTLVATVSKKPRRGAAATSAVFDINVGEGRYINLMERGTVECLDTDMKDAAISQLKILQNQMESLMAQLNN